MKLKYAFVFILAVFCFCSIPLQGCYAADEEMIHIEDSEDDETTAVNNDNILPEETTSEAEDKASSEETTEACKHNYEIIGFQGENGIATIKCSICGDTYNDEFVNHISKNSGVNENYSAVFDVVPDKMINGKDYAYLLRRFYTNSDYSISDLFQSKQFLFKEQFGYIYISTLLIFCTGCICISARRKA